MRWAPFFLGFLLLAAACVVEDKLVADAGIDGGAGGSGGTGGSGGVDACGGCSGDTPVCIEATMQCVQCTVEEDEYCEDRSQVCDADTNLCKPCLIEEACCLDDDACTSPGASRCDLAVNECAECETNMECDGVDGLDPVGNACDDGVCRECTPESESETCDDEKSCNPRTNECTDTTVGSLEVCDACVADSECGDGGSASDTHRCVPMYYPDEETRFPDEETGFCLKIFAIGGCERPYAIRISERPSLSDDLQEDYCGISESLTTCPAVQALVADDECPGGQDEECEVGGVCRDVGGLPNRCTYLCGLPAQCPEAVPANTCGASGSGGDDYCGG